jgi:hypothetical protein
MSAQTTSSRRDPRGASMEGSRMSTTKTKTRKLRPLKAATANATPKVFEDARKVATTKYAVGDDVIHPQFGDGTVTDIEGDKLTIKFAGDRMKQIVDYYVKRGKKDASSRAPTGHQTPPPSEELPATGTE